MILLLGATGLLGSYVLASLKQQGLPVRVLARGSDDWRAPAMKRMRFGNVDLQFGDVLDKKQLAKSMEGCTAIVNTIGTLTAKSNADLERVNLLTTANIVELIAGSSVERLLHVSCLGARETSESESLKMKWLAEERVRESQVYWTVFRPSFLFADDFPLYKLIEPLVKFPPFLPVIGSGLNLIQPVSAPEVAQCIANSIYNRVTVEKCFNLAGPKKYAMTELMQFLRRELGMGGPVMNLPVDFSATAQELIYRAIPGQFKNSDLARLLTVESSTDHNDLEETFDLRGKDLQSCLSGLLAKK